jgi:hypothetical protein
MATRSRIQGIILPIDANFVFSFRSRSRGHFVLEQPRDIPGDLSGSDHAPRDVAKRADAVSYIPTPVSNGATWRLLGAVLFTVFDKGGGVVEMIVSNGTPFVVNTFLTWAWGGVTGESSRQLAHNGVATLRVILPPGFDATLEIIART